VPVVSVAFMAVNPFLVMGTGKGPLARLGKDPGHALANRSGHQRREEIRSGGGGRRAHSSRGGAGQADLHASTINSATPGSQRFIRYPARSTSQPGHECELIMLQGGPTAPARPGGRPRR